MVSRILVLTLFFWGSLYSADIHPNLVNYLNHSANSRVNVWIFFTDKGPQKDLSVYEVDAYLSERAIKRRQKMHGAPIIKMNDYPVYGGYINQLNDKIIKLRSKSRWLNAISATVSREQINTIKNYDFIKEIRLVNSYKKRVKEAEEPVLGKFVSSGDDSLFYGESQGQLEQIGAIAMHKRGFTGAGVYIAMLDDGFNRYKTHTVFDSLQVIDTWDFTNGDDSVDDPDGKYSAYGPQGFHGTQTLSVIGGNEPGKLIGSAYHASYLLYKTEIDSKEVNLEEDHWVAGLERAERMGADVVNSSLGYKGFDSGELYNYTWEDMDGNTAVTTKATIVAEANGLIVVNSAGNNGFSNAPNSLNAPADGEFVITVGGVNKLDQYWTQSSFGPTVDGRIKPDVCAQGVGVYRASSSNDNSFSIGAGTSFSSPLAAGAIGLLVEAFPEITPKKVREAIRKTASQPDSPDNFLGYGVLNIDAAYMYIKNDTLPKPKPNLSNPFNVGTAIYYNVKNLSQIKLAIYDVLGQQVVAFPQTTAYPDDYKEINASLFKASGIYFYRITGKDLASGKRVDKSGKLIYLK
jgi:serine protease AprX